MDLVFSYHRKKEIGHILLTILILPFFYSLNVVSKLAIMLTRYRLIQVIHLSPNVIIYKI